MPARAAEDASAIIAAALDVVRDDADVTAAVELFAADLGSNGGVASTLSSLLLFESPYHATPLPPRDLFEFVLRRPCRLSATLTVAACPPSTNEFGRPALPTHLAPNAATWCARRGAPGRVPWRALLPPSRLV